MGFMENLRRSMPVVIVGMIVVFVLLIVFEWGDAKRGAGRAQLHEQAIGTVNGEQISLAEFEDRVSKAIKMQRESNANAEINDDQIRESIWSQMVDEILIRQAAAKLGIVLTDQQFQEQMLYNPPQQLRQQFTDSSGTFQEKMYQEFMTNVDKFLADRKIPDVEVRKIKEQKQDLEDYYHNDMLRQAVESAIGASGVPSLATALNAFRNQKSKVSGTIAALDANTIKDSISVSDQEAQTYFEAHRDDYHQKYTRELTYAMFPLLPSAQDSGAISRRTKAIAEAISQATTPVARDSVFAQFADQFGVGAYNGEAYTPLQQIAPELQAPLGTAKSGDVIGPIQSSTGTVMLSVIDVSDTGEQYVKAEHILLKTDKGVNEDSVKKEAEKIYAEAKAGKSFEMLASMHSQDPGSAPRGGDLGFFKKGSMVKPFEDAAFAAAPGSIVGPVKSTFGYHIIKVIDKSSKSFKLKDLKLDVKPSNNTKNLLRRQAQEFRDKLTSGGTSLDSLGAKMKVQILNSGVFGRSTPAAGSTKLTAFAYDGSVGDISEPIELQDGSLVVAQISKVHKEGVMTFDEAKDKIVAKLRMAKRVGMLKDRMTKLRQSLNPGDSLSKLSALDPAVQVQSFSDLAPGSPLPQIGFDFPVNAAVYSGVPVGKTSDPIKGERGYYVVSITSRTVAVDDEFAKERDQFLKQQMSQKRTNVFQKWLQKAKELAVIEDFRGGRH